MVAIVRRGLDTLSRNEPLRLLWLIPVGGARQPDKIAVFSLSDVAGINRVAIFVAAAIIMKNWVNLASIPIVSIGIADQGQPDQCNVPLRPSHGMTPGICPTVRREKFVLNFREGFTAARPLFAEIVGQHSCLFQSPTFGEEPWRSR